MTAAHVSWPSPRRPAFSTLQGVAITAHLVPAEPVDGWLLGGRYRVVARIGSGGMADVFRAHDEVLARDVAVKVFRNVASPDAAAGSERQQAELRALASLNHPNLIALFDGSLTSAPPYLVLELVDGTSLAERIAQAPLTELQVRLLGTQIASALAYVHAHNMVHRDVKPANILLGTDASDEDVAARARLSDFGIVRMVGAERMTSADMTVGSASYLAPEQARGLDVGPAADVYALGLVLLEALTGSLPFEGDMLAVMTARVLRAPAIPSSLPEPWPQLLADMTAMEPGARPAAADVERILQGRQASMIEPIGAAPGARTADLATVAAQDSPPVGTGEWEPRHHRKGLLAAALAATCVAGVVLLLHGSGFAGSPPVKGVSGGTASASTSTPPAGRRSSRAAILDARTTPSAPASQPPSSAKRSSGSSVAAPPDRPTVATPTMSAHPASSVPATSATANPTSPAPSSTSAPATPTPSPTPSGP